MSTGLFTNARLLGLAFAAASAALAQPAQAQTYKIDDGTPGYSISYAYPEDLCWLNRLHVNGTATITSVEAILGEPERRARQAKAIRRWQPWTRSTGPRTAAGKARSSMNRYRGGVREMLRERFGLAHVTLQVETAQFASLCSLRAGPGCASA